MSEPSTFINGKRVDYTLVGIYEYSWKLSRTSLYKLIDDIIVDKIGVSTIDMDVTAEICNPIYNFLDKIATEDENRYALEMYFPSNEGEGCIGWIIKDESSRAVLKHEKVPTYVYKGHYFIGALRIKCAKNSLRTNNGKRNIGCVENNKIQFHDSTFEKEFNSLFGVLKNKLCEKFSVDKVYISRQIEKELIKKTKDYLSSIYKWPEDMFYYDIDLNVVVENFNLCCYIKVRGVTFAAYYVSVPFYTKKTLIKNYYITTCDNRDVEYSTARDNVEITETRFFIKEDDRSQRVIRYSEYEVRDTVTMTLMPEEGGANAL